MTKIIEVSQDQDVVTMTKSELARFVAEALGIDVESAYWQVTQTCDEIDFFTGFASYDGTHYVAEFGEDGLYHVHKMDVPENVERYEGLYISFSKYFEMFVVGDQVFGLHPTIDAARKEIDEMLEDVPFL